MRSSALIGLCFLGLCGCANPAAFQQPITTFSTAADSAATTFTTVNTQATASLNAIHADAAIAAGHVNAGPQQCEDMSTGCQLYYVDPGTNSTTPVYTASVMPKTVAVVNAIKAYADALVALEKADASSDVQAAFAQSITTASAIAGTVNPAAAPAGKALSGPLSSAGEWVFLQYQNDLKLNALKAATATADKSIQAVKSTIDAELSLASKDQTSQLAQAFRAKHDAFALAETAANLQAEIQAANALDAALTAKLPTFFDDLAAAHAKLAAAVQNPNTDITDVMADLTSLVQEAQNVEQAVNVLAPSKPAAPAKAAAAAPKRATGAQN